MTTGQLLKEYRERNGFSQKAVETFLGLNRVQLSYYENDTREVPLDSLEKLADLYGAELSDFFETDSESIKSNMAFAFRAESIADEDLSVLADFKKVVKNYLKICNLEQKHGCKL